ncbi:hypothetical protein BJF83_07485 [Nocardiopsis sp. CNR-923]|nr:hypothetical protein BJF83_07485 [Nocardiopsis sp. CNR-923]
MLALLLLRSNTLVQTAELINELWRGSPPPSAVPTLQTYVYKLRKILRSVGEGVDIQTRPSGYMVSAPDAEVDVAQFEECVNDGKALFNAGGLEESVDRLTRGLSVWRGPALADVEKGELLASQVARLEELRLRALELRIEVELRLGHHEGLIGELRSLTSAHPLHEGLHAKLMVALNKAGRRYEALDVYRALRETLVLELGLEPSLEVRAIQQDLLSADPGPDDRTPRAPRQRYHSLAHTPAQIPPDVPHFRGYRREMRMLEEQFSGEGAETGVRVASITGMPGVGKTALAIRAAHRLRWRFEDGQLFAKLGGDRPALVDPLHILEGFLGALGVPADTVPDDLEEAGKLFRTCTADSRILVVLDNAASAEQVEHLFPGNAECGVIVTSRPHILHEAEVISLGGLGGEDAIDALRSIVRTQRVDREPREAAAIVRACGGLPLAVRVVGARLAAVPGLPLASIARELDDADRRLDYLRFQGLDLRSRYDSSYMQLHVREASLFRLLSILPDNVFTAAQVARFLSTPVEEVEPLLATLVEKRFLQVWEQGGQRDVQFYFHELIKLYARERLRSDSDSDGAAPRLQPTAPSRPDRPRRGPPSGRTCLPTAPRPRVPPSPRPRQPLTPARVFRPPRPVDSPRSVPHDGRHRAACPCPHGGHPRRRRDG